MVTLILTICLTATNCTDYTVDTFDTEQQCNDNLTAFIIERRVPASEARLLSCKEKSDD